MTTRDLRAALVLVAAITIAGCGSPGLVETPAARERDEIAGLYTGVLDSSQKLTESASEPELVEGRSRANDLLTRLKSVQEPREMDRIHARAMQNEVRRLDAALTLHRAKAKWEGLHKQARLTARESKADLPQQRALLRKRWPVFRLADDQLIAAERAFADAQNRLAATLRIQSQLAHAETEKP